MQMRQSIAELSDETVRKHAPSVFSLERDPRLSERYAMVHTASVLEQLRENGFVPIRAVQSLARDPNGKAFARHSLTLVERSALASAVKTSLIPTARLVNSHNGTSRYLLFPGLWRLVCDNGLLCSAESFKPYSVTHRGGGLNNDVIEGTFEVLSSARQAALVVDRWHKVQLSAITAEAFAQRALALRYPDPDSRPPVANRLLDVRRGEDEGGDLWHVFNRVQEALTQGGAEYHRPDAKRNRFQRLRPVRGIAQDVKLNRQLWQLAEEFAG